MTSVAVVVLDTLRYDTFRSEFDWLPGRWFHRAYAPSHWTIPVHGSLFTGRYPSETGVHGRSPALDCPETVLAERFAGAGYDTRMFTANSQLERYDGWDRGFDEFVPKGSLDAYDGAFDWGRCLDEASGTGYERYLRAIAACVRSDSPTLRSLRRGYEQFTRSSADGGARSTLERVRATPFGDDEFLFVNLMEAHTPYHPPPDESDPVNVVAADAFTDEPLDLDRVRAAYDASASHLSDVYRDLFAELSDSFDYVVTLSDHGELLGEHGMLNHSFGLWPELTHVPLVVSGTDVTPGDDHRVATLLDVHRTVAELAGVDVDSRGRNLLGAVEPTDVLFEYHGPLPFHEGQFERKDAPTSEFRRRREPLWGYVDSGGAYAHETHERGLRRIGDFADDPRDRLDELVAGLDRREVEATDFDVSADVRDQLEDLGYA